VLLDGRGDDTRAFARLLGRVLQGGVLIAGVIVVVGAALYLSDAGRTTTDFRAFRGEPADLRTLRGIIADATAGSGRGLIQFGLLVLIATPVARVFYSVLGFALERDWLYVMITLVVLALLGYSLLAA
jgi:uncharacterized membrane protein